MFSFENAQKKEEKSIKWLKSEQNMRELNKY